MAKRVIWFVMDSAGIGEMPDADSYGDVGANTIGHVIEAYPDINIPNLTKLGIRNISGTGIEPYRGEIIGCYGKANEVSNGKDTTTGHWEMAGIYTMKPFPVYPEGFPEDIIEEFIRRTGCKAIYGNKPASGLAVIDEYAEEHYETGYPIIYTSADSVFQIAASEEITGLDRLYELCEIARNIMQGEHAVGRIIARPFVRKGNGYERTPGRRDFALKPPYDNLLPHIKDAGLTVSAVGKIGDIFNGVGVSEGLHTLCDSDSMDKTYDYMQTNRTGLIFTNLVDFDMKYGHRRNVLGYKDALETFDRWLGSNLSNLNDEDVLVINADHGCDPTMPGSDHTREYAPVLIYSKSFKKDVNLGILSSFSEIGEFVEAYLLGGENALLKKVI